MPHPVKGFRNIKVHRAIIKRMYLLAETCAFPQVIYTNFVSCAPYVYKNALGHIKGLFAANLQNVVKSNYSNCKQQAAIDFVTNGRNGWAEKKTINEIKKTLENLTSASQSSGGGVHIAQLTKGMLLCPLYRTLGWYIL